MATALSSPAAFTIPGPNPWPVVWRTLGVHPQDRQFHLGVGAVQGNVREMVQLP